MSKLDYLDLDFKQKIIELKTNLETVTGLNWCVVSGKRSLAEQDRLYQQGRTTAGEIVTKAPAGHSPHNFGLAVDLCPYNKVDELWWNAPDRYWRMYGEMAEGMGLVWGGNFKSIADKPHVETKDWRVARDKWKEEGSKLI